MNIELIVDAYVECALWADGNADSEFTQDEMFTVWQEICSFTELAGSQLSGLDEVQIGHDFYLTRNHHGAGFWDRDLGAIGESLTKMSHLFGETDYDFCLTSIEAQS